MKSRIILSLALAAGVASTAQAQKGHAGGATPARAPVMEPMTPMSSNASTEAQEATKKSDKRMEATATPVQRATPATRATPAIPGQHGTRATPAVRATPATPASAARKTELKADEKSENHEFSSARKEPDMLMRHIKLTPAEHKQVNVIRKKYDDQFKALEKQEKTADKTNGSEAALMTQLTQLRAQEQAELRAILTPAQQTAFDANATATTHKKK